MSAKRDQPVESTSSLRKLLGDDKIGLEGRVQLEDHLNTRLWLRLLACSTQIENVIRERLRIEFEVSLARFDYMAQLYRWPTGLRVQALTNYLMVSGGNVTNLTKSLVDAGLVARVPDPDDRRSYWVRLTPQGRKQFAVMAKAHEKWLHAMFKDIPVDIKEIMHVSLGYLRAHVANTP